MEKKSNSYSDSFCILPWIHRFTNIGGEIQVCCTSDEFENNILHENGQKMKAPEDLDDEIIMNSRFMKNLRVKMLNGEWDSLCTRCCETEKNGALSRRKIENQNYKDLLDDKIKATQADGKIDVDVRSIDYRTGNTCNLKCRMCSPRSSMKWIPEWNKYEVKPFYMEEKLKKEYLGYDWYKDPKVKEYFARNSTKITQLHFAGGEPLLTPEIATFLDECVKNGSSKNIELSYNTNLTKIPDQLLFLWPEFKGVRLFCSIDGYSKVNDVIRSPSKWSDIDKNLKFLEKNFHSLNLTYVLVTCTLQAYNIYKISELFDYVSEFKHIHPVPLLIDLYWPAYYRTQIFSKREKIALTKKLNELLEKSYLKIDPAFHTTLESLKGAINFLNAEDYSHYARDFITVLKEKDAYRNEDTFSIIPELKQTLIDYEIREIELANKNSSDVFLENQNGSSVTLSVDELKGLGLNKWKNWQCSASNFSLYVNADGNAFSSKCRESGYLGNIYEKSLSVTDSWINCTKEACNHLTDISIPKVTKEEFKNVFFNKINSNSENILDYRKQSFDIVGPKMMNHEFEVEKSVVWEIGRLCNLSCSYCSTSISNNYEANKNWETLKTGFLSIVANFSKNRKIKILLTGGEPTLNPNFNELCKLIASHNLSLHVQTNGTADKELYLELIKKATIEISMHLKETSQELVLINIEAIMKSMISEKNITSQQLIINAMVEPGFYEQANDFLVKIKRHELFNSKVKLKMSMLTQKENSNDFMNYTKEEQILISQFSKE